MISEALVLGIESSCDECSASVVSITNRKSGFPKLEILSLNTFSQIELHQPYGGVVPEVASRNHLETLSLMVEQSLKDANIQLDQVDVISVTNRPGLVGALLVGVSGAKALAYAKQKPLLGVHHLEGHIMSLFLEANIEPKLPILVAIVSGGHTNLHLVQESPENWSQTFLKDSLVGRSLDDAAGEAFDKIAKLLGYPYPGGAYLDRNSKGGDPKFFDLPRALQKKKQSFDFSFSGLKTAASLLIQDLKKNGDFEKNLNNLCASAQEAIVDALVGKMKLAAKKFECKSIAVVGGVAANSRLREKLKAFDGDLYFPNLKYCTDNAAMIAAAGGLRFMQGHAISNQELLTLNAYAASEV